jgi:hypothetical protein
VLVGNPRTIFVHGESRTMNFPLMYVKQNQTTLRSKTYLLSKLANVDMG